MTETTPRSRTQIEPPLAAVLDLARLTAALAGAGEVLPALVRAAVEQLGADAAAALQLEPGTAVVTAAVGEPLVGWSGEIEALDRSLGDKLHAACTTRYQDVHTLPLVSDTDLFGALVLFFERRDALDGAAMRIAGGLANLAAAALAKAARYDALERAVATRDEAQAELRATVESLHALIDTAGSAILFLSPEGRVLEFNRTAEHLSGYSRSEALGSDFIERFVAEGERERSHQQLEHVLGGARLQAYESDILTRDGQRSTLLWNADRLVDPKGVVRGVVAVGQDISERKVLEHELLQAQKMEAMGRLATGIAHDFNNVLMGITGCAEVVLGLLPLESEARSFVQEIKEAGLRGAGLTRQLKVFAKPRAHSLEVVDLNHIVHKSRQLLAQVLPKGVELLFAFDAPDATVVADRGQLEQSLLNLVINACDAMPQGGAVTVATTERSERGERWVALVVSDTGHGMDDEVKRRLFEPFFTTKAESGTGLGLSMVRAIVEQAGGKVEVESSPGAGSAFRLWLAHTDKPAAPLGIEMDEPARGSSEVVMVVEDDPSVRMSICRWLEDSGYRVFASERGDEAASRLARSRDRVDALVVDMRLPGLPGPEVVRAAREAKPELPVVYITAQSELHKDAGADPVLAKPFRRELLLAAIARALKKVSASSPQPRHRETTLLVVDDDQTARRALRMLLSDRYRVIDAGSGDEALERLEGATVDALITDIRLPGMPVMSLVEELRARFPELPVVCMSGHDSDDPAAARVLSMPRSTFVPKPIEIDALIATIDRALLDPA
jgi:PAS domain S-box-containing protein